MDQVTCGWLMLACCALLTAAHPQDNVLRFRSQKEIAQDTKKHSDDIIVIKDDKIKELVKFRSKSTECPDGVTECSDSTTCCPLPNGQYGCCEGADAVCCSDGVHCCPQGYKCDMAHGQCTSVEKGISFGWVDKKVVRSHPRITLTLNKTCDDRKTICEKNDTCCNATVGLGCCPEPDAMCCSDKLHCCPKGTKCDMVHRRCFRQEDPARQQPWLERRGEATPPPPSFQVEGRANAPLTDTAMYDVVCPDGSMCPDGNTCCAENGGGYGCCAHVDAVCCTDHIHCCPHGYTCDYVRQGCDYSGSWSVEAWSDIVRSSFLQAVCCSDQVHCCPQGCTCDMKRQCCTSEMSVQTWSNVTRSRKLNFLKVGASSAVSSSVSRVVCPGGGFECPDGTTCCELPSGGWGCCPKPNALCCSDKIHCCPQNYTCDVIDSKCVPPSGGRFVPWEEKKPAAARVTSLAVTCPGGRTQCADGQTCCQEASGDYGCCPYPKAVCCSDHAHCCPEGYTCNLAAKTCERGSNSLPWLNKEPASPKALSDNMCPDGKSQCNKFQSCCKNTDGGYSCCPTPKATCCNDHIHCCPQGYTCDTSASKCLHAHLPSADLFSLPLMKKEPAMVREGKVVCPDKSSECADGQTCCKLTTGQYGCCPKPNAVCCADHLHCCPEGFTCDTASGRCNQGLQSLPWEEKKPAVPSLH